MQKMFPLRSILKNKHNIHVNFRSCIRCNSVLPSGVDPDIVKFAKRSLTILVEAKAAGLPAKAAYELQWCPWPQGSAEVSTGDDERSHEGPNVEEEADPAGADLDPHCWPLAGQVLELGVRAKKTEESQEKELDLSSEPPPSRSQNILQGNWTDTAPWEGSSRDSRKLLF